jgi:hypothetical protein
MSKLAKWGTGAAILAFLLWRCGKGTDNGRTSVVTSVAPSSPPPSPPTPPAPPSPSSAFDSLWASASPGLSNYRPYLALKLSKAAYCAYLSDNHESCGDQFEPDKQYKQDLETAKVIRDSTWRAEIDEGFGNIAFRGKIGPGTFDVKRSILPFVITWPINLGESYYGLEASKRRLAVDGAIWKETPEQIAELKFADGAAARGWKEGYRRARMVFKITDAVTQPYTLLIIKEKGLQLRELDDSKEGAVLAEDLAEPTGTK